MWKKFQFDGTFQLILPRTMYIICNKISSFIKNLNRHTTIPIFLVPRFKSVYTHMPMKYTAVKNSYNKKARNMILKRNNRRRKIRTTWHCWGELRNWKMSTYPTSSHIVFLTCISMYIKTKKFFLKKQRYRLHNVIGTILLQYVYVW